MSRDGDRMARRGLRQITRWLGTGPTELSVGAAGATVSADAISTIELDELEGEVATFRSGLLWYCWPQMGTAGNAGAGLIVVDSALPNANLPTPRDSPGDERWLWTTYMRSSNSSTATEVVSREMTPINHMTPERIRAQRKIREGEVLKLVVSASQANWTFFFIGRLLIASGALGRGSR